MSSKLSDYGSFLEEMRIPLRLSCSTSSGWPMILSLWYLYQEDLLFLATRKSAKVVGYLTDEPRCAFEIAADVPPYCGIRGQARADIDLNRGGEILEKLLIRYQGGISGPLANILLKHRADEVAIILKPVNLFSWNFSNRMDPLPAHQVNPGICP